MVRFVQGGEAMTQSEFIAWAEQQDAAGVKDPMGWPWTSWKVLVYLPGGQPALDQRGYKIYETQAEFKARHRAIPIGQTMELFA
jgi:hypothetical protein